MRPIGKRVIVKVSDTKEHEDYGIGQDTCMGVVVSSSGILSVATGDKVVFIKYAGVVIKVGPEAFEILDEDDILAVL